MAAAALTRGWYRITLTANGADRATQPLHRVYRALERAQEVIRTRGPGYITEHRSKAAARASEGGVVVHRG